MAYIVGDACIKCKYTDCVAVCPVDCFYEGENTLAIHPDECIHCGACEPECPTNAIYDEDDLPEPLKPFIELNALFSGAKQPDEVDKDGIPASVVSVMDSGEFKVWPVITDQKDALPEADANKGKEGKLEDFSAASGEG